MNNNNNQYTLYGNNCTKTLPSCRKPTLSNALPCIPINTSNVLKARICSYIVIDSNGIIWRGWCAHGGPIGSIYELPIQFPTDPIVCGLSRCGNGFDQQSRKEH